MDLCTHVPPSIEYPYNPREALDDIPGIRHALDLFVASHMLESEEYCNKSVEKKVTFYHLPLFFSSSHLIVQLKERLGFATGYGLIHV